MFRLLLPLFFGVVLLAHGVEEKWDWDVRLQEIRRVGKKEGLDAALRLAQASLTDGEKKFGPDSIEIIPPLREEARILQLQTKYPEVEPILKRVVAITEKKLGPDHPDLADALTSLGWLEEGMASYPNARELFERALQIREAKYGHHNAAVADSLNSLGVVAEDMGEFQKSEAYYLEALNLRREILGPENSTTATSANNLGTLYWSTGDYGKAEQYFTQALDIRRKSLGPKASATVTTMNNLALLYRSMGDDARAEPLFRQVLALREETLGSDHPFTLTTMHQLGLLYASLGRNDEAEALLLRAAHEREKILGTEHPDVARSYFHLAWFYDRCGKYAKAEPLHLKALQIRLKVLGDHHPETAGSYSFLARHYHVQGMLKKAEPLYEKAFAIENDIMGLHDPDTLPTVENLAWLYIDEGRREDAMKLMRRVIETHEAMLQNLFTFTSEKQRIEFQRTLRLYDLPANLGSAEDIARVAFRTKGVVLDSLIEDRLAANSSNDPHLKETLERLQWLSRQIFHGELEPQEGSSQAAARIAQVEEWKQEEETLECSFVREVAGMGRARRALQVKPEDVREALPEGTALLEFIQYAADKKNLKFEPAYGVLVVTRGKGFQWVPLGGADEIDEAVRVYQKYIRRHVRDVAVSRALHELSEKVWIPLIPVLPAGTDRLLISPDGKLNFISFATLLSPGGAFLAEKYHISYLSSGRDLLLPRVTTQQRLVAVFADPAYDGKTEELQGEDNPSISREVAELFDYMRFTPLPGTEKEAQFLSGHGKGWGCDVKCFLGADATEKNLSAVKSPYVLHLATHGVFLPAPGGTSTGAVPLDQPPRPFVELSHPMQRSLLLLTGAQQTLAAWEKGIVPPTENDGIVTAQEVGALNLQGTWLVVLSACDTGLGDDQAGEGVLGLRRGFLMAGAQNLLLTLWAVSDAETASLIESFYTKAFATGDPAGALDDVQRERLVALREKDGIGQAVRLAGPFILNVTGSPTDVKNNFKKMK